MSGVIASGRPAQNVGKGLPDRDQHVTVGGEPKILQSLEKLIRSVHNIRAHKVESPPEWPGRAGWRLPLLGFVGVFAERLADNGQVVVACWDRRREVADRGTRHRGCSLWEEGKCGLKIQREMNDLSKR